MDSISALLSSAPLPFKYVEVPGPSDPAAPKPHHLRFYVNKVITRLSTSAFDHAGFDLVGENIPWNASWGRQYTTPQYKNCKPWQKINHYAGAFLMGRKDNLHSRMTELHQRIGDSASFYPKSYLLPNQHDELVRDWESQRFWIAKPSASSRGRGIHLISSDTREIPDEAGVVQAYIEHPLLITGRKFDIRLYVLVSSISPVRIYIHDSGLARFATHKYNLSGSASDLHMHLTNFSVNKTDKGFVRGAIGHENIEDSKWSLPFLLEHLKSTGIDTNAVMTQIESVVISTIIAGMTAIRPFHENLIQGRYTSYEMYGLDVMLDENLKPYIIEVNISPAMSGIDSQLDQEIKWRLMLELLEMAKIIDCDASRKNPCPGLTALESAVRDSLTSDRVRGVESGEIDPWENPVFADFQIVRDFFEEKRRRGGFRRIFPKRKTMSKFIPCFDKLVYSDIVFTRWIQMDKQKKAEIIANGWGSYREKMAQICESAREAEGAKEK